MTKDKSQATFKTLRDNFEPNNDNTDETIDQEMQRSWRLFLAAGYDATQVAEMMLPEDVLKYYDKLVFYGADINALKRLPALQKAFIKQHWKELVNYGVHPDILADRYHDDYDVSDIKDLERLLSKDIGAAKSFELIKSWLDFRKEWPEEISRILI